MVPCKVYGLFCWLEVHKRNKRSIGIKKGVSIYMGINYSLFICFLWGILMHSLRKSLPEACMMLCKLTVFDIIFIQFYAFFCKVFIFTNLFGHKIVCYCYSKWGPHSDTSHIWQVDRILLLIQFVVVFFLFCLLANKFCWELSVVCRHISSIFNGVQDKLDHKWLKSANFQIFCFFSSNFNAVFAKCSS